LPTPQISIYIRMALTVELVSAEWCKPCSVIKPQVIATCSLLSVPLSITSIDDMDEEQKGRITSLPTIILKQEDGSEEVFTKQTLNEWKSAMARIGSQSSDSEDF